MRSVDGALISSYFESPQQRRFRSVDASRREAFTDNVGAGVDHVSSYSDALVLRSIKTGTAFRLSPFCHTMHGLVVLALTARPNPRAALRARQ
jgi:hypothetical protein